MVLGNSCPGVSRPHVALALGERGRGEALPAAALRLLEALPVPPERYPLALSRARVLARGRTGELVLCEGYADAASLFGLPPGGLAEARAELALLAAYLGPPSLTGPALAGLGAFAESLASLFYLAALNGKSARLCCRLEGEGEAEAAADVAARILGDSGGELLSLVTIRAVGTCAGTCAVAGAGGRARAPARLSPDRGVSGLPARR